MIAVIFWIGLAVSLAAMVGIWFVKCPIVVKVCTTMFFFLLALFFFFQDQNSL